MSLSPRFDDAPLNFGLVGDSPQIHRVLRTIRKLSNDVSPVLVTGESGVGKELVARALHQTSPLAPKVYLPVDSASLVGTLMESELFGHQRGAFTGAVESKIGLVRAANGGTLFLDEIGELSLEVQAKLLRLLQEGEMRPVGAAQPIKVDVRIVAATNRDLAVEVERGRFRGDLFYRLNVINIRIPPLRERPGDIPQLIEHFLDKHGMRPFEFSRQAMEVMCEYDWPGNVRELENSIRRMIALHSDPLLTVEDLPSPLQKFAERYGAVPEQEGHLLPLAEVERRHILRVLNHCKGDMSAAAMILGIGRTTLYRKLKAYRADEGLDEQDDLGSGAALIRR